MTDNGKPPTIEPPTSRKAPTAAQRTAREFNDLRNARLQATKIPQPSTGIFGSLKNKPQPKAK